MQELLSKALAVIIFPAALLVNLLGVAALMVFSVAAAIIGAAMLAVSATLSWITSVANRAASDALDTLGA